MSAPLLLMLAVVGLGVLSGVDRLGKTAAALIAGIGCLVLGAFSLFAPITAP